jgi:hypothetical protein
LLQDLEAKPHDYQSLNIEEYETELREMLVVTMHEFGWKTSGEVRCRVVSPSGWMRKLGIAGIYWPYSAEGHIDDSFLFSTKLFSMIHEMSHGYGVTDEGEANFIALKTLLDQEDAFFRISGELGLLRDALGKLKHINEQLYLIRREALDPKSTLLLDELNANSSQYPPFFPGLATFLNDIYLKMQGVEAGIESYNQYLWMASKYVKNL